MKNKFQNKIQEDQIMKTKNEDLKMRTAAFRITTSILFIGLFIITAAKSYSQDMPVVNDKFKKDAVPYTEEVGMTMYRIGQQSALPVIKSGKEAVPYAAQLTMTCFRTGSGVGLNIDNIASSELAVIIFAPNGQPIINDVVSVSGSAAFLHYKIPSTVKGKVRIDVYDISRQAVVRKEV
jgi:hypothetical protein